MEIATTKLSSRGQIVIPVSLREGFVEGENLVILKEGEDLIIRKENKFSNMLSLQWGTHLTALLLLLLRIMRLF